MADTASTFASGQISRDSLDDAYAFLLSELDRCGVRSTAAFVSSFGAGYEAVRSVLPELEALGGGAPGWFQHLLPRLRRGNADALSGLEGDSYWKAFAKSGHEMAWHGSTHLPFDSGLDPALIELELAIGSRLHSALQFSPKSIVFPRNQIGHLDSLKDHGFEIYRDSKSGGFGRRLNNLLREYNVWDEGDDDEPRQESGWGISPSGHFLNWPHGARGGVPVPVTVQRWKSMLRAAAEQGRYVHMWFHPHNLITAPRMRESLSQILDYASELARSGDLQILTMGEAQAGIITK